MWGEEQCFDAYEAHIFRILFLMAFYSLSLIDRQASIDGGLMCPNLEVLVVERRYSEKFRVGRIFSHTTKFYLSSMLPETS
jgi:hypothetical protein